jgi:hypothetical protein
MSSETIPPHLMETELDSDMREQLGHLRGRIEGVENWLARLDANVIGELRNINDKIDKVQESFATSRGGHGMLSTLWIGGGGAAFGYLILHALNVH